MNHIKSLSLLLVFLTQFVCFPQWISLDKTSGPDTQPDVQLISDDDNSTVIKVDLHGFQIEEFNVNGRTYHEISCVGDGITSEVGFPEISHIAKVLAIPDNGSVSIEILETSSVQVVKSIRRKFICIRF